MEEIAILNVPLPTNIHTWHYMLPPLNPDGMYINTLSFLSIICLCLQTWVPPSLSLSFTLYIYTHEKRYPTYTHKEREQMIDNLTEKRCASRTISRCGLKAIMRNMNQIPNLLARDVKYKQLPFFNNNYFYWRRSWRRRLLQRLLMFHLHH